MMRNQSCYKIQVVRSDNGKKYASTKFNLFYQDVGIEYEHSAPYTPEQNESVKEETNI
jgi:transposase InsO family protein